MIVLLCLSPKVDRKLNTKYKVKYSTTHFLTFLQFTNLVALLYTKDAWLIPVIEGVGVGWCLWQGTLCGRTVNTGRRWWRSGKEMQMWYVMLWENIVPQTLHRGVMQKYEKNILCCVSIVSHRVYLAYIWFNTRYNAKSKRKMCSSCGTCFLLLQQLLKHPMHSQL